MFRSTGPSNGDNSSWYAYGNAQSSGSESPTKRSELECGCEESFAHGIFGCLEPFRPRSEAPREMRYAPQPRVPDWVGDPRYDLDEYNRLSQAAMRHHSSRSQRRKNLTASAAPSPSASASLPRANSRTASRDAAPSETPNVAPSRSASPVVSRDNAMNRVESTTRSPEPSSSVGVRLSRANSQKTTQSAASSRDPSAAVSRDNTTERAELISRLSALHTRGLQEAGRSQRSSPSGNFRQPEEDSTWVGISEIRLTTDPRASGGPPTRRPPPPPASNR